MNSRSNPNLPAKIRAISEGVLSHPEGIPSPKGCLWHGKGMPCGMGVSSVIQTLIVNC